MSGKEWTNYSRKYLRHPKNPEFVTGRVNIINNRNTIRISIGKVICELVEYSKGDRIEVLLNKNDKNSILICKTKKPESSYVLCQSKSKKSNFLSVVFRYDFHESFKLTQTIILDYDINENKILLVNIEKLKWRE